MFINISNHPSETWGDSQKEAAHRYGEITDIPFPEIHAQNTEADIEKMAETYVEEVKKYEPEAVMIQGESVFTFRLVRKLKILGVKCVSACSERTALTEIQADGTCKNSSIFRFVKFLEY